MSRARHAVAWASGAAGVAAGAYAAWAGSAWLRYGHVAPPSPAAADPLLDHFMPVYEVVERHHIRVGAPADVTYAAAKEMDLTRSRIVRAIFRTRELLLGAEPEHAARPSGIVALTQSLGWGVLAEHPGRELVMGAVTQPWMANVVFRALPPDTFAGFEEPGFVKIAWTLRADPLDATRSVFRTETRVIATSADARVKFRRYWAWLSPGIIIIRRLSLRPLKAEAERRGRVAAQS
ncbi:MAG: hypothetical protein AB7H96_18665 [Vicinamibacterales bacterium]